MAANFVAMERTGFSIGTLAGVGALLTGALMNTIGADTLSKTVRIAVPVLLGGIAIVGMVVGGVGAKLRPRFTTI